MSTTWNAPLEWTPPADLTGRFARLVRLTPAHAPGLWSVMEGNPDVWRWLFDGPFDDLTAFEGLITRQAASPDPYFYAISGANGPVGFGSLMRCDRANGVIEIGNLCFSPAMQRSGISTEAIFLMADHAFGAGFRRLEWKCNALNAPSRAAALRFGFAFEGIFRQHMIVKGANRDTAWFAILDGEWPALRTAFQRWLDPANFEADGTQRKSLSDLTAAVVDTLGRA